MVWPPSTEERRADVLNAETRGVDGRCTYQPFQIQRKLTGDYYFILNR